VAEAPPFEPFLVGEGIDEHVERVLIVLFLKTADDRLRDFVDYRITVFFSDYLSSSDSPFPVLDAIEAHYVFVEN